ncbi:MAG: hypothetical protein JNM56_03635 [Planctomycetia bacterium]|nr:hypothetical protein [Planctomycetia bacterium]
MIPSTTERVPQQTAESINERIRRCTERRIARCAEGGPAAIEHRLRELDREWDIERTLEANAATAVLTGVALGATVDRKFFFLPAVVAGFLLHRQMGCCPRNDGWHVPRYSEGVGSDAHALGVPRDVPPK